MIATIESVAALPDNMQIFTDPVTGKMFIGKVGGDQGHGGESFEVWTDPETGKQFIRTKDGQSNLILNKEWLEIRRPLVDSKLFYLMNL